MNLIHDTNRTDLGQGAADSMDSNSAILAGDTDIQSVEPMTLKLSVCQQAAVEQLNGMEMNGYSVEVEPAHGAPGGADRHSARSASIFVKGFGPEASLSEPEETGLRAGYSRVALRPPQMQICGAKNTCINANSPSTEDGLVKNVVFTTCPAWEA